MIENIKSLFTCECISNNQYKIVYFIDYLIEIILTSKFKNSLTLIGEFSVEYPWNNSLPPSTESNIYNKYQKNVLNFNIFWLIFYCTNFEILLFFMSGKNPYSVSKNQNKFSYSVLIGCGVSFTTSYTYIQLKLLFI